MFTSKQIIAVMVAGFLSAALMLGAVAVGAQIGSGAKTPAADPEPTAAAETEEPDEDLQKSADEILITGFEKMRLKAGTFSQDCDLLYNSAANDCDIIFSLYLPDDTVFFVSDPVKPGDRVENMEIDQRLEAGTYEGCRMLCDCYDAETEKTLNGAEATFTLEVIP